MIQASGKRRSVILAGILLASALLPRGLGAFSSKQLLLLLGFGGDDHDKLTTAAVANVDIGYPDVQRFKVKIVDESSNEGISGLGAHDRVSGADPQIWADNERLWREEGRRLYLDGQYADAYARFAWAVHLVEDIQVPAHKKDVFHGLGGTYAKSPDDSTAISGSIHIDRFEKFASNNHNNAVPPDINFDQTFLDPKTGCNFRFWLNDGEDGDASAGANGAYGRNNAGCSAPFTGDGEDWFADPDFSAVLDPLGHRIARAQLFQAREAAETELRTMSEGLPPRPSLFTIGGAGGGAPPIVNGQSGSLISFSIAENRTEFVDIDLYVQETGQRILAEGGEATLDGTRAASGVTQVRNLGASISWLAKPVQLFGTKEEQTLLPFEAGITTIWKGAVASGSLLTDGTYNLCLAVRDRNNNGPGSDSCVIFSGGGAVASDGTFVLAVLKSLT